MKKCFVFIFVIEACEFMDIGFSGQKLLLGSTKVVSTIKFLSDWNLNLIQDYICLVNLFQKQVHKGGIVQQITNYC